MHHIGENSVYARKITGDDLKEFINGPALEYSYIIHMDNSNISGKARVVIDNMYNRSVVEIVVEYFHNYMSVDVSEFIIGYL